MKLLKKAFKEFNKDHCTDLAAALTYYSVLAVFPAILALMSLLGVVGEGESALNTVLDVLRPLMAEDTLDKLEPTLRNLATSQGASVTLAVGVAVAFWSASGYIGAFGRAMNRIREVEETRPFWKLRPLILLITVLTILLCAAALLIIVVSGPIASSIGDQIGLGDTMLTVWNIAKWPALALLVVVIVTTLYRATPNVKRQKFRWLTLGSFVAILTWLVASVGFAFYVANFSSYDKTYGSVAGVIVGLLWLWLTNLALLFGAELDLAVDDRDAEWKAADTPYPRQKTSTEAGSVMDGPDPAHDDPPEKT